MALTDNINIYDTLTASSNYNVTDSSIYNNNIIWDDTTWKTTPIYSQPITSISPNSTYQTYPSLTVDGEITFKGEKLSEIITEIRDALYLLKRDKMREEKYEELKLAAEEYNKILNRIKAMEVVVGEDSIE